MFRDHYTDAEDDALQISPTKVYCLRCPKTTKTSKNTNKEEPIELEKIPEGSVVISNANYELTFDEETKLLSSIKDKRRNLTKEVKIKFGGYPTVQFRNGAYLFKIDPNREPVDIIDPISKNLNYRYDTLLSLKVLQFVH